MVPESRASQKILAGAELEAKRADILQTHGDVLKRAGNSESFRPRKRHRVSVEKCLNMWDNQVRLSVHEHGLWWFSKEAITYFDGEGSAEGWPGVSLTSDQGSDMVSLVHATLYHEPVQLNLWEWWDILHGVTRDLMCTVTAEDLKPLVHLILMCINLPHGPEESDYRFKQIVDFMTDHYAHSSPRLSPFFQHMLPELAEELEAEAIPEEGESLEQAVWRVLKNRSLYKKKGNKAHIGRYGAVCWEGMKLLKSWNCCLFESSVPSAEGSMINTQSAHEGQTQVQWCR